MEVVAVVIVVLTLWNIISWVIEVNSNSNKYQELKPKLDRLGSSIEEHELKMEKDKADVELAEKERSDKHLRKVENARKVIEKLAKQKSMGFPWLADAYVEYNSLIDFKRAEYLANKKHPAYRAQEVVIKIKNEKKILLKENKVISYKINYYEKLFPWLAISYSL